MNEFAKMENPKDEASLEEADVELEVPKGHLREEGGQVSSVAGQNVELGKELEQRKVSVWLKLSCTRPPSCPLPHAPAPPCPRN